MCLIVLAFVVVFVTDEPMNVMITMSVIVILLFLSSGSMLGAVNRIAISVSHDESVEMTLGRKIIFSLSYSFAAILIMAIWFIGYNPGSYQPDCIYQFSQAMTGVYSDWHPVLQTVFTYTIPLRITGGAVWAPVVFQLVFFSLSMGYMCETIHEYMGKRWAFLSLLYIILNPFTAQMMLYPWKDAPFAIMGMISVIIAFRIYVTGSEWADSWWRCLILSIVLSCTSIFRHNGILFSVPLLIAMVFIMKRRQWVITLTAFVVFTVLIKGGLYRAIDVNPDPQSVVQQVGLPLTIIGNVAKETPELMDEEVSEFVYKIAPQEVWENGYQLGNFGVMKYYAPINSQVIEDEGAWSILKMGIRCFYLSPRASFKAAFALTDLVYGVDLLDEGYIGSHIEDNSLGIVYNGNPRVVHILEIYYKLVRMHGINFFRQSAFSLLMMLTVLLSVCNLHLWNDWKKVLLVLPIFLYSFGTMLLLTDPASRFFFIGYLVCPVYLSLLTYDYKCVDGGSR